jgi:hypothetical protein
MKFIKWVFGGIARFFKNPDQVAKVAAMTARAAQLITFVKMLVPGVPYAAEVSKVYEKFGLPVTEALADGKLTAEELKYFLQLAVAFVLSKEFGISTTQANILVNGIYEDLKPAKA